MIDFRNPYTPGSGRMPSYLAGRDKTIEQAVIYIKSTMQGYPRRSVAYYGYVELEKLFCLTQLNLMLMS